MRSHARLPRLRPAPGHRSRFGAAGSAVRKCGESTFDFRIRDVRPLTLYADQRCSNWSIEATIRILPAPPYRLLDLVIARIAAGRRIDFRKANSQSSTPCEERG